MKEITLYKYDQETDGDTAEVTFSVFRLARSLDLENFSDLMGEFLNLNFREFPEGLAVGHRCRKEHRTIQRSIVCFALGILAGISEQEHTDARNETAIETAKKIRQMITDGDLPVGMLI